MDAEQFLHEALGGNIKPLAWHEIMESYAKHKTKVFCDFIESEIKNMEHYDIYMAAQMQKKYKNLNSKEK